MRILIARILPLGMSKPLARLDDWMKSPRRVERRKE